MQAQLAQSAVGIDIKNNEAQAREAQARGEAAFVRLTGEAEASKTQAIGLAEAKATEALGLARAAGFQAQTEALGQSGDRASSRWRTRWPTVTSPSCPRCSWPAAAGAIEGLAATLMRTLGTGGNGARRRDAARRPNRRHPKSTARPSTLPARRRHRGRDVAPPR